jgi:hypothetical protein
VCEKRDKKGVYKKAKRGLLKNFTGGSVTVVLQWCYSSITVEFKGPAEKLHWRYGVRQ